MISNQDRLNLIRDFCEDDFENRVEKVLKNILENGSSSLKSMIKLFDLMDNINSVDSDLQTSYTIGNRKIEIKNNCVYFYLTHNNKNYELLRFEDGKMYASSIEVEIKEVYNDYKSLSELISSLSFECTGEELEQIEPYIIGFIL